MKSLNRGANIQAISPRVTRTNRGSSTDLSESPLDPDVLWVGTDEGNVWVTRDGGANWTEVTENIGVPGPYWVASVEASRYEDGRAFVAFDAHRSNDDAPFLYMTDDFGETWTNITNNLPVFGSTRVLREDIQNENLLYVGTEFAAFASIDRGASWTKINNNDLPTVAVHDFAQHPTRGEIVAGTHGRSLWVLDVTALRQFTAESIAADAKLYRPNTAIQWDSVPGQYYPYGHGVQRFYGENPPGGSQIYYSLASPAEAVSLKIIGPTGETIRELGGRTAPGLHRVNWNHQGSPDTGGGGRGGAAAFAGRGGRGGQGAAQVQTEQQQGGGEQQTQQGGRRGRRGAAGGGQQQQVRGGAQGGGEQTQQGGRRGRRGAAGGGVQGGGQQQQVQGGAQGGGEQTQQGGRRGRGGEQAQQRGGRGGRGGGGRGGRGGGGRGGGGRGYGPGIYRVVLTVDGAEFTETLTIEADKRDG
jgi:hypothetical protein